MLEIVIQKLSNQKPYRIFTIELFVHVLLLSHLWWSYPEPEFLAEKLYMDPASEMRPKYFI